MTFFFSRMSLFLIFRRQREIYNVGNWLGSNDLPSCLAKIFVSNFFFVNNTGLFASTREHKMLRQVMKSELNKVKKFCNINTSSINLSKTRFIRHIVFEKHNLLNKFIPQFFLFKCNDVFEKQYAWMKRILDSFAYFQILTRLHHYTSTLPS